MGKLPFPPGFRFSPTDVELVKYYLKRKVMGKSVRIKVIAEVDIYKYAPWDLPERSCWRYGDLKWYFFCSRGMKYASGARVNRATEAGYWKMSGKDRPVNYNGEVVGWIKTLVFHRGKPPRGERTDWVLHEYRLDDKGLADMGVPQESCVLCVIFQKEGAGPKNGAQYGAPFKEEDWTDDEVEICLNSVPHADRPEPDFVPPRGYGSSKATSSDIPEDVGIGPSSESCVSDAVPPSCNVYHSVSSNTVTKEKHCVSANGDILSMLDCFGQESAFLINGKDQNKEPDNLIPSGNIGTAQNTDSANATKELDDILPSGNENATDHPNKSDFYRDLEDLGNLGKIEVGYNLSSWHGSSYTMDDIFELVDLDKPMDCDASLYNVPSSEV
ncbi:NAC domain-containing protein 82-like [Argentina anserina]|uniref:NAC domain-containing protein 82-like n=1 Tax=Argentina anserina TaxID=57926 RepID=UPI0021767D13|nr:NAC domain-containing protein 82-like [Potentilla anserina]